ncbi:MAG: methyl-accepting chemotaxis protein, partial [Pirellulales bacterium]|nr:methyl-accepting chemotaxis protein [Pirellulales bacterium]
SGSISLALSLLFAWLSYRLIARPMQVLAQTTMALADGNLDVDVPNTQRGDEIGAVSSALLVFRNNLLESRKAEERARQSEAKQAERRREEMHALADEFEANVKRLVTDVTAAVTALNDSSEKLSTVAEKTTEQVMAVQEASESAAESVNTVAGATEELSSSVREVATQAGTSSELVDEAAADADRTNEDMAKMSDAVAQITEVTTLIQEIAEQTNLLALNATIEAARAGEAGKGFAVVASEVKELASQTGKATEQIDRQVQEIQATAVNSLQGVEKIAAHLGNITEAATAVAATAGQQGAATSDIASSANLASEGTGRVTEAIDGIRHAASETSSVSAEFRESAAQLREQASDLNDSVDAFIEKVRAA